MAWSYIKIIFYSKDSEVLHYECYNSTNLMENSISCFLKNVNKSQTKSIQQIQKELLSNKRKQRESLQNLNKTYNVNDIKVVSPFYARPDHCSNHNCLCPYHRKLRIKQIPLRKIQNRPFYTKTANNSPNKIIRPQIKEDQLLGAQRFTVKSKGPSLRNKLINWQGRKKVDSHNQEFDSFLSQFEQILLKKTKLNAVDSHKIKSSVGKIFKYIYTHLHQERQMVQNHISKLEKDRDFTSFYMQRFIELKERKIKTNEEKRLKALKQRTMITNVQKQVESKGRKNSRARTKYQRREFIKKTNKSRYHKLIVEQFLEDINCGQEIADEQLENFVTLEVQKFQENCQFLQKNIMEMDQGMLQQLLNQIVHKAKRIIEEKVIDGCRKTKMEALDKLIDLMNGKIEEIRKNESQEQKAYRMGASSHSIKTRGNSIHSINRNKKVTILGKFNQSLFAKSGFNQTKKENNDSELSKDDILDNLQEKVEDKQQMSGRRQSPKAMTIFIGGEQEKMQVRTGKSGKLQLAKYRRLSHDVFYHKKILGESDQQLIYQKMKIVTLENVSGQLQNLAFQFAEKKYKLREIEGKIKDFCLDKYIIQQTDSLITAKRKIRVIKGLLKDEQFDHHLKGEMKEYLTLIEEQNYLKNRRWANKKIKNVLQTGMQDQEVQLCQVEEDQGDKYYFQRLMSQLFGKFTKLIFYQISKSIYQQKEINFEQHIMEYMHSTISLQKKQRQIKSGRKKTEAHQSKIILKQKRKQSVLMQKGLNNKGLSNSNFLVNQQWESQQLNNTGQPQREEQPIQLSEDSYLSLLNRLAMLNY